MIKNLGIFAILILLYLVLTRLLKLNLKTTAVNSFGKMLGYLGNANMRLHNKNMQEAKINKNNTFAKSKVYKIIKGIILDLNYEGVTVEGFISTVLIISLAIGIIIYYSLGSLFLSIVSVPGVAIFFVTFLFMTSSDVYYKRQYAIMDAESLISSSIKTGVYASIENNLPLFDDVVKPAFIAYIKRIKMKVNPVTAIKLLGDELGISDTRFINELIQYQVSERSGSVDIFKDIDKENADKRTEMLDMQMTLQDINSNYLTCNIITAIVLVIVVASNPKILSFFFENPIGNLLLIFDICVIVYGFARIQSFRN